MRNFMIIFFLGVSFCGFSQVPLSDDEVSLFKQKVIQLDENTKTIVSDFTQYKHLSFLNNDIKTTGKLVFKVPNTVKWEYTSPYKYSIVFNENRILINDDGDKSNIDVGSNKMFKSLNNIITNSVKGNMFNDDEFTISYFDHTDHYLVKFVPKDKNMLKFIAVLELMFSKKTSDVTEVKMIEPSNDYTRIVFNNKTRNTAVSNEVFNN